jgi:hypothetical protein
LQYKLSLQMYQLRQQVMQAIADKAELESRLKTGTAATGQLPALLEKLTQFDKPAKAREKNLSKLDNALGGLVNLLQDADSAPTIQAAAASNALQVETKKKLADWDKLRSEIQQAHK